MLKAPVVGMLKQYISLDEVTLQGVMEETLKENGKPHGLRCGTKALHMQQKKKALQYKDISFTLGEVIEYTTFKEMNAHV